MSADLGSIGPMQRDMLGELRRWYDAGTAEAGLAALREEIAHELAEKIRAEARGCCDERCGELEAADLIDPEVE